MGWLLVSFMKFRELFHILHYMVVIIVKKIKLVT